MSSRVRLFVAVTLGVVLLALAFVAFPYWWLTRDGAIEVSVRESGPHGDRVSLRVPASLVRLAVTFVPTIESPIDDPDVADALVAARAALEAMEDVPDAVFVAVDEPGTRVRIAKKEGRFVVEVDDDGDQVRIVIPQAAVGVVADALPRLTGPGPS
jgi:hypothetical protein